jgi:type I site-specific restriction-modification system R (restriction) subunit
MLDGASEARLEQLLGQKYHLITRDDRLETVAKDIVRHFLGRSLLPGGQVGKAMVVSIDKATALRTHDKVAGRVDAPSWDGSNNGCRRVDDRANGSSWWRCAIACGLADMAVIVSAARTRSRT